MASLRRARLAPDRRKVSILSSARPATWLEGERKQGRVQVGQDRVLAAESENLDNVGGCLLFPPSPSTRLGHGPANARNQAGVRLARRAMMASTEEVLKCPRSQPRAPPLTTSIGRKARPN